MNTNGPDNGHSKDGQGIKDKYRDTSRKNAHVCNMNILILITVFRSYDQLQFLRKKSRVNTRNIHVKYQSFSLTVEKL